MNNLLYYLLQVNIVSSILYLYYHSTLRNKKFHQYNRFYLLATVMLSILIPFLNIPVYFSQQEAQSSFVLKTITVLSPASQEGSTTVSPVTREEIVSTFQPADLLYYAYLLLAALAMAKLIVSLLRIRRLARSYPTKRLGDINFVNTQEPSTPFSFLRWLFWHQSIELNSVKGEQILRHELFHIRQRHTLDILFTELVSVIFWINPFFYLVKKELRAIHEFLADRFAVNETEKWHYAELLLMQVLQTRQSLVNPFFNNQVKRRVAMITNSKKTSYQYLRKLLVLPLAILIIGVFAFSYQSKNESIPLPGFDINSTPDPSDTTRKRSFYYSHADQLIWETDTIISYPEPSSNHIALPKAIYIVNGETKNYHFIKTKTILSDTIIFYGMNNKETVRIYGNDAASRGVIVFKNAGIIDRPPAEYYKNLLSKDTQNELSFDMSPKTLPDSSQAFDLTITESHPEEISKLNSEASILQFKEKFSIKFKSLTISDPSFEKYVQDKGDQLLVINEKPYTLKEAKKEFNGSTISSARVSAAPGDAALVKKYGARAKNGIIEFKNAVIVKQADQTYPAPALQ